MVDNWLQSIMDCSVHLQQFLDKKDFGDYTKALHQIFGDLEAPGDFTFYCKFLTYVFIRLNLTCVSFSYNTIKTWIQGGNRQMQLGPTMHMVAAAEAGVLTLVMTNPIWVVKTRLCLQYESVASVAGNHRNYSGMLDALSKIYKYEGVRGLYKVNQPIQNW